MSNIRPVSDLRNYNDVLNACREDAPVYLTKKGRGKYVLMDIEDYEKIKATLKLMAHIEEGEKSSSVNAEFKCLKTDGVQCPQTAGENGKLFGLAIFIKSTLH